MEVQIENILKQGCWKNFKKKQKNFNIYYDTVITVYDSDDIDFNKDLLS